MHPIIMHTLGKPRWLKYVVQLLPLLSGHSPLLIPPHTLALSLVLPLKQSASRLSEHPSPGLRMHLRGKGEDTSVISILSAPFALASA